VVAEMMAVHAGHAYFDAGLLDADVRLVVAPLLCLVGCVVAIKLVFPLSQLGGVKTASDLALLLLVCACVIWFFSKFRGWGILFFGSFLQLIVVLAIVIYFMRRLYRRAFHLDR
jgi:hypothetical protein